MPFRGPGVFVAVDQRVSNDQCHLAAKTSDAGTANALSRAEGGQIESRGEATMKLAEALVLRADYQKRLEQLW